MKIKMIMLVLCAVLSIWIVGCTKTDCSLQMVAGGSSYCMQK